MGSNTTIELLTDHLQNQGKARVRFSPNTRTAKTARTYLNEADRCLRKRYRMRPDAPSLIATHVYRLAQDPESGWVYAHRRPQLQRRCPHRYETCPYLQSWR